MVVQVRGGVKGTQPTMQMGYIFSTPTLSLSEPVHHKCFMETVNCCNCQLLLLFMFAHHDMDSFLTHQHLKLFNYYPLYSYVSVNLALSLALFMAS